jgi:uncharacterized membrane protein
MSRRNEEKNVFENITTWMGSPASFTVHTLIFLASFSIGVFQFVAWDRVLLVLTTILSLEAIYFSIFIQMTVNRHAKELEEVSEDIEDIQEDVEEISEDVEDIQEDVDEIQKDVDEIQEDVEEINEENEDDTEEEKTTKRRKHDADSLEELTADVRHVLKALEALKK